MMTWWVCRGCGMRFRAVNVTDPSRRRDAEEAFKDHHARYGCEVFLIEEER